MKLETNFMATGIGSVPFTVADKAVDIITQNLTEAPFWPQMPRLGMNEQMEIQYSEGLPRVNYDRKKNRMYFDTTGDTSEELAEFYMAYMAAMDPDEGTGDCSAMRITPDFAAGLYAFEEHLKARATKLPFLKVQITGPCSFALTIVDQDKRSIYYNEEFRDVIIKGLAMKARWQIQGFAQYAEKVICFIDEPILSAFGSSTYVSVKRDEVIAALAEVVDAIHAEGALAGIHCCGNTEWSIPIESGADIINFDAYEYGDTIAMYPEEVKSLFTRGGALAWGIVPTSEAIRETDPQTLAAKLDGLINSLAAKGVNRDAIRQQSLVTPSCGTGSMAPDDAKRVFETTAGVSEEMRRRVTA